MYEKLFKFIDNKFIVAFSITVGLAMALTAILPYEAMRISYYIRLIIGSIMIGVYPPEAS